MPSKPIMLFLAVSAFCFAEDISAVADWESELIGSSFFLDAIPLEELDGSNIVRLAKSKYSQPLLYPKLVSFSDLLDSSSNDFWSLADLARNPELAHNLSRKMPDARSASAKSPSESNVFTRERNLFDPSLVLVPRRSGELPSDEQLKAFVYKGKKSLPDPKTQRKIITNLLADEYADHPVARLLSEQNSAQSFSTKEPADTKRIFAGHKKTELVNSHIVSTKSDPVPIPFQPSPVHQRFADVEKFAEPAIASTSLKLLARKPTRDGNLLPAQASEIYLTTQNLRELLKDLTQDSAIAGEVKSVAELWAKAEKNFDQNPEVALGVKSILLQAKVGRARTDPFGKAALDNLTPEDKYFLIGIDKDDQTNVVTIWSKEVEVEPGENMVELTSTDVIYQE